MKHIFIVNPTSGKGDGKRAAAAIQKEIEQNHLDGEIRLTEYAGQAQQLAAEIKPDPETIVYAVGGDGTTWEVLNVCRRDCAWAFCPAVRATTITG